MTIPGAVPDASRASNRGVITAVRGSVVDVRFDDYLPPVHSTLTPGEQGQIVIEVLAQRDAHDEGTCRLKYQPIRKLGACAGRLLPNRRVRAERMLPGWGAFHVSRASRRKAHE